MTVRTGKIAVVDDDAGLRVTINSFLRSFGYDVDCFASAEEFLECMVASQTACIITDIRMPGMSGIELQSQLIGRGHRIPMIFMTAFPEEGASARTLKAGACGFLTKPFRQQSLLDFLSRALNS